MKNTWFILLFGGLLFSVAAKGQKQTTTSNQQWMQYYSSVQLTDKISFISDYGLRRREHFSEWSQTLVRAGVGYELNQNSKVVAGVAFLTFLRDGEKTKIEYRPYQELTRSRSLANLKIQHRIRLEQRFFQDLNENEDPASYNLRFRYRLYMNHPVADLNGEKNAGMLSFNAGNEVMFNSGNEIAYNHFDSNRILAGPSYQMTPGLSVSLLYNHLYAQRNQPNTFSRTHVLWLGIKHNIHFD